MGSTNVPPNEDEKNVRVQCQTPDDGQFDFIIDASKLQDVLTILVNCKYKAAGCITNDYVKNIKEHEERCLYRTIRCPVQSTNDECESVLAMNLVQHVTSNHRSDYICTEEAFFSLPIDLDEEIKVSKLVTICDDTLLFRVKREERKLHTSVLFMKNTNVYQNLKITIMADDMKWNKHKIQLSDSNSNFYERGEQSAEFDLEKLIQVRNAFNSISVRVDFNIAVVDQIVQSDEFLQKIICTFCGDFLTSVYYECNRKHMHCKTCYELFESVSKNNERYKCRKGSCYIRSVELYLCSLDTLKKYEYPCPNQSHGCKQYIPRSTSIHELLCPSMVFECVFGNAGCKFSGKHNEFISHLRENHTDNIVNKNVLIIDVSVNTNWQYYMFAFGSVFLCKHRRYYKDTDIEWISTSDLRDNFTFEVSFLFKHGERTILKTNTHTNNVNYKHEVCKSVYNTLKKTAYFELWREETLSEITVTIHKEG